MMDFKEKAELFNDFFQSNALLLITTASVLTKTASVLTKTTCTSLSSIEFSNFFKKIRNLNPNKAHSHDMVSIRMLKNCDEPICKPLGIIIWTCLENGKFPSEWKKVKVVPVFKKKLISNR